MLELAGFAGLLMLIGCFVPQEKLPTGLPHDSLLHIGAFALLSVPFCISAENQTTLWLTALAIWILGFIVECVQQFVPTRRFGVDDLFYNAAGIALVAIPCSLMQEFAKFA